MKLIDVGPVTDEQFDALIEAGDYEREPELIDGYVEWRDDELTTTEHGAWVMAILKWFSDHDDEWDIRVFPEVTNRPAPSNSLVPDVTVISADSPREKYITNVPLAVFEVSSPRQGMVKVRAKLAKYQQKGIQQIWFVNPDDKVWQQYINGQLWMSERFTGVGNIPPFSMLEISKLVR